MKVETCVTISPYIHTETQVLL